MKNSISSINNCYGCGVCAAACPKKIIDLHLNKEGFYEPYITAKDVCTNCGLCLSVCSFTKKSLCVQNEPLMSYAAWSNDFSVRRKCSSGGVGFELAKKLLDDGYLVCGCKFNIETNRAEHYIATTKEELIQSIGSKYIQSYTVEALQDIDTKKKYLMIGTPCQIDSFRRYIKQKRCEENFILMDFYCHGVPTMLAWQKYSSEAEQVVGKITYVSWRNKQTGWHDSWAMCIDGEQRGEKIDWYDNYNLLIREKKSYIHSRLSKGDSFYLLFLGDQCLGKQCYYDCKFKYDKSSADIRIGDCWGSTYSNDEDGVSCAVAFSPKGYELLQSANLHLNEHPFEIVAEGQMRKSPVVDDEKRDTIIKSLADSNKTMDDVFVSIAELERRRHRLFLLHHPRLLLKQLIKRLLRR